MDGRWIVLLITQIHYNNNSIKVADCRHMIFSSHFRGYTPYLSMQYLNCSFGIQEYMHPTYISMFDSE